jgi:Phytanoyl-CoA dioxygenase (PhyH)
LELDHQLRVELDKVGAIKLPELLNPSRLQTLVEWSERFDQRRAGIRVSDIATLNPLLLEGPIGAVAMSLLGANAKPVRAILFDKSETNNWALAWHQDRTIAVRRHVAAAGFGFQSTKAGIPHVEPPFDLIERMITVRIHIDAVDESNAPLRIAPGSHLLGRIPEADIDAAVRKSRQTICLAKPGDIWVYRTAILHASDRASGNRRRRVLQVDYSADELPAGLEWWAAA